MHVSFIVDIIFAKKLVDNNTINSNSNNNSNSNDNSNSNRNNRYEYLFIKLYVSTILLSSLPYDSVHACIYVPGKYICSVCMCKSLCVKN